MVNVFSTGLTIVTTSTATAEMFRSSFFILLFQVLHRLTFTHNFMLGNVKNEVCNGVPLVYIIFVMLDNDQRKQSR